MTAPTPRPVALHADRLPQSPRELVERLISASMELLNDKSLSDKQVALYLLAEMIRFSYRCGVSAGSDNEGSNPTQEGYG